MAQEDFKHGIIWMDWQHEDLIKEFHRLSDACEQGSCAIEIMKISRTLERYVKEHFGQEEAYMQKYNFPDFKKHQREHLTFRQKFKEFQDTGLKGEKEAGDELLWMIINWIMKHIMNTDKILAKFLAKKGVK